MPADDDCLRPLRGGRSISTSGRSRAPCGSGEAAASRIPCAGSHLAMRFGGDWRQPRPLSPRRFDQLRAVHRCRTICASNHLIDPPPPLLAEFEYARVADVRAKRLAWRDGPSRPWSIRCASLNGPRASLLNVQYDLCDKSSVSSTNLVVERRNSSCAFSLRRKRPRGSRSSSHGEEVTTDEQRSGRSCHVTCPRLPPASISGLALPVSGLVSSSSAPSMGKPSLITS
eukprot:scaffold154493_cov35-Tisochrysis_lutea.AAC.2